MSILRSIPPWNSFEIHNFRSADRILLEKKSAAAIEECLCSFSFTHEEVLRGGGGSSLITQRFERSLREQGYRKEIFTFPTVYEGRPMTATTHEVDGFGDRIGIEFEWNNKNTFFDRDLSTFHLLFSRDLIDLGIIITRSTGLSTIFKRMVLEDGLSESKFSTTTTHSNTLLNKLLLLELAGTVGSCPILAIGITESQLRTDAVPICSDLFSWV